MTFFLGILTGLVLAGLFVWVLCILSPKELEPEDAERLQSMIRQMTAGEQRSTMRLGNGVESTIEEKR